MTRYLRSFLLLLFYLPVFPAAADTLVIDVNSEYALRMSRVVLGESRDRSADIAWLARQAPTRRWIAQTQVFYSDADSRLFRRHLKRKAKDKQNRPDTFDLTKISARARDIRHTAAAFAEPDSDEVSKLIAMLRPLLPQSEVARLYHLSFYAGGRDEAWWAEKDNHHLYINLARASEPGGVRMIAAHNLYHGLQADFLAENPAWDFAGMDGPTRVWAAAVWEGTAAFAGDPRRTRSMDPYHLMLYEEYTANDEQTDIMLRKLEELLVQAQDGSPVDYRTYHHDPLTALIDDRVVWAGYAMTLALANRYGEEIIPQLLQAGPLAFADAFLTMFEEQQPAVKYRKRDR